MPNTPNEILENLLIIQGAELEGRPVKESDLNRIRENIPTQILAHFDRLIERGKKGVAMVRHCVCGGCHMRLPIGTIATLRHGNDIQLCETCGRYLYWVEEESESPAALPDLVKPSRGKRKKVAHVH